MTENILKKNSDAMGIVDVAFNGKATHIITSCMDSTIRVYDLHTQNSEKIECDVMENWKADCFENNIITGGDSGKVVFFDVDSREKGSRMEMGDVFITGLGRSQTSTLIASGNNSGKVHVGNPTNQKVGSFDCHHKIVRDLCFLENDSKCLSASDDTIIKMVDIPSEKVQQSFEGHKLGVTSITSSPMDPNVFFSTSFDKFIKAWDTRAKDSVASLMTASPLWDCRSLGKTIFAGGDTGVLYVYSME